MDPSCRLLRNKNNLGLNNLFYHARLRSTRKTPGGSIGEKASLPTHWSDGVTKLIEAAAKTKPITKQESNGKLPGCKVLRAASNQEFTEIKQFINGKSGDGTIDGALRECASLCFEGNIAWLAWKNSMLRRFVDKNDHASDPKDKIAKSAICGRYWRLYESRVYSRVPDEK